MSRLRTIDSAYDEIKALDPNTAITKHYIRQLVTEGHISSKKAGAKYLFNLDTLLEYFEKE